MRPSSLEKSVRSAAWCAAVLSLCACSPPDDWREWQPDDSGLRVQTPCKPSTQVREVVVAGSSRRMTLHTCRAVEHLYGLAWVDVGTPAQVDSALRELAAVARGNVAAADAGRAMPLDVAGATPQPGAGRWQWLGRLPDGRDVQQQGAVFSRGTRVYQASVVASALDGSRADPFFASLAWRPHER
jgi:hypothetical protein